MDTRRTRQLQRKRRPQSGEREVACRVVRRLRELGVTTSDVCNAELLLDAGLSRERLYRHWRDLGYLGCKAAKQRITIPMLIEVHRHHCTRR